jgi:hypothetical protein
VSKIQGVYVNGKRPASKKAIKEAVANLSENRIRLEATSLFGDEYDGSITDAPDGMYTIVGPDPYTSRKFYGNFKKSGDNISFS